MKLEKRTRTARHFLHVCSALSCKLKGISNVEFNLTNYIATNNTYSGAQNKKRSILTKLNIQ